MAITILQKPGDIQPAQSPIVFSVLESTQAYTSSEFQYTANLYVWSGTQSQSGSYLYQARKYPNPSGSGIFDFSKFINSTLTKLTGNDDSVIKYYKAEFGWQYASGSSYVTQSGGLTPVTCSAGGVMFLTYDGYNLFPNQINTTMSGSNTYFPFMTDMPSVTQSVLITDVTRIDNSLNQKRGVGFWYGISDQHPTYGNTVGTIVYSASYDNGSKINSAYTTIYADVTSSDMVYSFGTAPGDGVIPTTSGSGALTNYQVKFVSGSITYGTLNYEVVCEQYYTPVRICWKNRFGQLDWLNFYKRHNNTFNTDQRIYQPQLGTWESSTLSYNQYQTAQQRYIVDATEVLEVNTAYLSDGYNEIMKQLLVSDEIYWLYDQTSYLVKPLTIQTNSLQFKTGVNNKLIQYTITFDIGQPYKLLL